MNKKQKKTPPKSGKALVFKVCVDKSRFNRQLFELESCLGKYSVQFGHHIRLNGGIGTLKGFINVGFCDDVPAAVTNCANVVIKRCRPVLDVKGLMAAIRANDFK